jgi:hypothetical protein
VKGTGENLRMFRAGPQSERGGMIARATRPALRSPRRKQPVATRMWIDESLPPSAYGRRLQECASEHGRDHVGRAGLVAGRSVTRPRVDRWP